MFSVLIVEDDPMVAAINKKYLERTNGVHLAGVVSSGEAAADFLRHNQVSLVLLDVFMPGMDGFSLLKNIREEHPGVDVIMVTAARASADIQNALRLGVTDYIVKPFTFERFQAALYAYTERARFLQSGEDVSQEILDKRIFAKKSAPFSPPKGIDAITLARVRDVAAAYDGEFRTQDLAPLVGISRVSIKKYLEYLESISCLTSTLVYLPVGRPVTTYRWCGTDRDVL